MDPELKQRWVEALRSGKYQQIRNDYHNEAGYCAIGLLQVVMGGTEWQAEQALNCAADVDSLIDLNDNQRFSFQTIADFVEQNL